MHLPSNLSDHTLEEVRMKVRKKAGTSSLEWYLILSFSLVMRGSGFSPCSVLLVFDLGSCYTTVPGKSGSLFWLSRAFSRLKHDQRFWIERGSACFKEHAPQHYSYLGLLRQQERQSAGTGIS
jgi:hypothetical protein